jgi:hypothetical protein
VVNFFKQITKKCIFPLEFLNFLAPGSGILIPNTDSDPAPKSHWKRIESRSGSTILVWATIGISRCDGRVESYKNPLKSAGCGISRVKYLGKSRCGGRDMPTVAPTIARITTVSKVEADSCHNPPNLDNHFLHRWMWYRYSLLTITLRWPIFKPKKRVRDF